LYNFPPATKANTTGVATSIGVIEFEGQNFNPADLATYATDLNLPIIPITQADTVGPNDPTNPQLEASLDVDMISSVNLQPVVWFWLEDSSLGGWLYQFVVHFEAAASVPQVISISYAWSEMDQCEIDPTECQALGLNSLQYAARINTEWQKIGVAGTSILVASGDSGTNGRTDPDCTLPYLKPDYPACSPFVTSVGATELVNTIPLPSPQPPICNQGYQCLGGGTEQAVSYAISSFASGGGFSTISPQPSWQSAAVSAYFASGVPLPPASYYNATDRGFPDVAAVGHDCLVQQGGLEPVGGTSCASPIFASVIALLNGIVISKTGKPLGFLNPFLYKMAADCPTCYNDITVGDNICTEDGCSSSCQGFHATKGWDPVTGWGTPNVQNMVNYVNKMFA